MAIRSCAILAILTLAVASSGCSGGSVASGPGLVSDANVQEDGALEQDSSGEPDLGGADTVGGDSVEETQVGPKACSDSDPCTFGETLNAQGECSGGTPYTCDDNRPCTEDKCDGTGDCIYTVMEGFCLADGVCLKVGDPAPHNPCLYCTADNPAGLGEVEDGTSCDDGDACTKSSVCGAGVCQPGESIASSCDDDDPCTQDACDVVAGCVNVPLTGTPCPPPDGCATHAVCIAGLCTPDPAQGCDDGNPCTADTCTAQGCEHVALDGLPCNDNDLCTVGDLCVQDQCVAGAQTLVCEDGNTCTQDLCHPALGCYYQLADNPCCNDDGTNVCDDGNFCTDDDCDPETGDCFYSNNQLQCNDFDVCTGGDICSDGLCAGTLLTCDDGNPCTTDSCVAPGGCIHQPLDGIQCDDGLECSVGDMCVMGLCKADMKACACQPTFSDVVSKINELALGPDGNPPNGLDIDANAATCSPTGKCSEGIDNALSAFAGLVGSALQDSVDSGSIVLMFEHLNFNVTGEPYVVSVLIGEEVDEGCDSTQATCAFLVSPDSFSDECKPLVLLDNATITGTVMAAGGPGYNFPFQFPISDTAILEVTLYSAQIKGTVTFQAGKPAVVTGVLGGAINKQQMLNAVENLPPEVELPVDKALVIQMLNGLVKVDIDSNGDGTLDAASVGMPFKAHAASITGMAAP